MKKSLLLFVLILVAAASSWAATPASEFLQQVDRDVRNGHITAEQALLYKIQYGFDPESLPVAYQPKEFSPLKCASGVLAEFERTRNELSTDTVNKIEAYLKKEIEPNADKATYISPAGHFRVTYLTTGTNAVPTADTDPANGIPDFVEKCAQYMDYSWLVECDQLGFTTPPTPTGYYEIDFEAMSYYGYTSPGSGGSSTITLHNTFQGFPPNTDPEGNVWGAAKATACHEFKHATQRAQSGWTEGGWVELDATWSEDIVYDYVNDYYNYLPNPNPISAPATSLDDGGSGSYEDCTWQHFMTENWGDQIIPDLWIWRSSHTSEAYMTSYASNFSNYGTSLRDAWSLFGGWNYLTGTRSIAGLGYGEAADYPTSQLAATYTAYPATRTGSVNKIAANLLRYISLPTEVGTVSVVFDGQVGTQLTLTAAITKRDGTGVIETIALDANNHADMTLSVPGEQILSFGLAVGNAAYSGGAAAYDVTVDYVIDLPDPQVTLSATTIAKSLVQNTTGIETLDLSNTGEAGSVLDFDVAVFPTMPRIVPGANDKSVAGSTMTTTISEYVPGTSYTADFTVTNGSTDLEWLTDITLDFPAGFSVTSSTNFVGGSAPMPTAGQTGNGATVTWHGTDSSGWGLIQGSQNATASVTFAADAAASGTLDILWTVTGDQYGSAPHDLGGSLAVTQAGPSVVVDSPNGGEILAIDATYDIAWTATLLSDVKLELSRDGGASWEVLAATTPNDGLEAWTVTGPVSNNCLIRVASTDGTVTDVSNAAFEIYQPVEWLTVSPLSGNVPEGSLQPLVLDFDATGLEITTHQAYLVISTNAVGSPTVVPVTLTVTDPATPADLPGMAFGLAGNYPNPFNPMTLISFRLPEEGHAVIEVLDVRGRLLRTVYSGTLEAGAHELTWDGKDDSGHDLASGLYLARLRSNGAAATHKMLLAR